MITRTGAGVALTGAALIVAGVLTGLPDFVVAGLGGMAAFVLALAWVTVTVADLAVRRKIVPARLREGEPAEAVLHVANRRYRPTPPLPVTETCAGMPIDIEIPRLAPRGEDQVRYRIPPLARGRHDIQPLRIGRCDPFRLLRRGTECCGPSHLIVHPRVIPLRPLFTAGTIAAAGPVTASAVAPGDDFRTLRTYEAGDDPRTIHWTSSARLGTLTVRVNVVPDQPRYTVALDTSGFSYGRETFDEAVRIAASLCAMALRAGFPLRLVTTAGQDVVVDPARVSASGRARPLDLLAGVSTDPSDPGLASLGKRLHGSAGEVLVVITGRAAPAALAPLPRLRQRHLVTVLVRTGDERHAETDPPGVRVVAPGTAREFGPLWDAVARR
jgi:uncharacterized protein (DUF58 family)